MTSGPAARDLAAALGTDAGWWFDAVSKTFKFLERDGSYVLTKVRYHQAGHYLRYSGPTYQITIELEPEWRSVHEVVVLIEDLPLGEYPKVTSLLRILETRAPGTDWHREVLRPHHKKKEVVRAVKAWGKGIRTLAPDLVAGALLDGVAWGGLGDLQHRAPGRAAGLGPDGLEG